ncbi:MAG: hypothetical protein AAF721_19170, partial [Myxococcota bacterium]
MRSSACVLALALLGGCSDGLPEIIWSGELIDYAASPEAAARLCAGTAPRLDAGAVAIANRLRLQAPPRMTYYWLPEGLDTAPCDERVTGGCARRANRRNAPGETFAMRTMEEHEVVHIYAGEFGRADAFLEEGLAEYLGGVMATPGRGDASTLYGRQSQLFDPTFYPVAGRFVAELVAQRSLREVMALYGASDYQDDAE